MNKLSEIFVNTVLIVLLIGAIGLLLFVIVIIFSSIKKAFSNTDNKSINIKETEKVIIEYKEPKKSLFKAVTDRDAAKRKEVNDRKQRIHDIETAIRNR